MISFFLFGGNTDRNCILRSLLYFREEKRSIALLLVFSSLTTLTGILQAWPLAVLIDTLVAPPAAPGWVHRIFSDWLPETPLAQIAGMAASALAIRIAQECFGACRKLLHTRVNHRSVLRVRCDLFRKLQTMDLGYHRSRSTGDTILRLNTDVSGCQMILGVLINVAFAMITISVILALLVSRSALLTVMALLVIPPLVGANVYFGRNFKKKTMEAKDADGAYLNSIHRGMAAIGLTQAFGREQDEFQSVGSSALNCARSWDGVHKQEVAYSLTIGAILGAGGAVILGYGGYMVHQQTLTPGELMLFMSYLGMLYDPLCQLTGAGMSLQSGLVSAKRVFEVLDEPAPVADEPGAVSPPVEPRTVRFAEHDLEPVRIKHVETGEQDAFAATPSEPKL